MTGLAASFQRDQVGSLAELLGLEWINAEPGRVEGRCVVRPHHLAPNGYLHAASVIALADTACGYGCRTTLPEQAKGFTTAELKANFLGTTRDGTISSTATVVHAGQTTQVWDASVRNEVTGKIIGLFRCTQIILY
ncbi:MULTISPECIES: PaaI family thioesterase [Alphaproteobacteria]|uniref:PaaI family thioesterase n=1 Tax=Alphaproteobacteria TaxID=28211 RepID=UPI003262D591